jgi:chemotaxis protein CheX
LPYPPHQHDLVRQLDESVAEVFAVMLNLACPPAIAEPAGIHALPCFIASVAFSGTLEGSCAIHLAPDTAAELTANLTGIPAPEISPTECADTTGELCNMIAGSWKTRQPATQAACHLSCPVVTLAQPHPAKPLVAQTIALRYHFNGHRMSLLLAVNRGE